LTDIIQLSNPENPVLDARISEISLIHLSYFVLNLVAMATRVGCGRI